MAKLDRNGNLLWVRQYGRADSEHVYDIAVTPEGSVLLCGGSGFAPSRGFLIQYSAKGQLEWFRHEFGGSSFAVSGTTSVKYLRLASAASGHLFASGSFTGPYQIGGARQLGFGSDDYFLVRFEPSELSEPSLFRASSPGRHGPVSEFLRRHSPVTAFTSRATPAAILSSTSGAHLS